MFSEREKVCIRKREAFAIVCNRQKEAFPTNKVYIFLISITRPVDLAMSVCPSVSPQTSLSVLKLSGWTFPSLSFAGSI